MAINLDIKATHMKLTPAIRSYVEEKAGALGKLIQNPEAEVQVDVEVGKTTQHHQTGDDLFRAEINLHVEGSLYRATSKEADLYAAIDDAKDDLLRQLRKEKTRRTDFVRRGALQFKKMMRRLYGRTDNEEL